MSKLYLECASGISGDMSVAALLDLGASESVLRLALGSLPLTGYQIEIGKVMKSGLECMDFKVVLDVDNHDHDMEYLHGHTHHDHDHDGHHHAHTHEEHHHEHHHEHHSEEAHVHRGLKEIFAILEGGSLEPAAKELAKRIFSILADAEAKAHGTTPEEVHFHEVGAVDSIIDIAAFAICYTNLGITETIVPKLCEGSGTVRAQHGILPVPVPAVLHIAQSHGLTLSITSVQGELITPTGAAIVAAIKTGDRLPDTMKILRSGYGAGKRNYERPSMLRAMLIEHTSSETEIWQLMTNIDDCSGEVLGYTMERLFEEGARDVHYIPVFMKKNRPAYELVVLCMEKDISTMEQIIFANTSTIGIRRMKMERTVLERHMITVETPLGEAMVKVCEHGDTTLFYPEYESVKKLAKSSGESYQKVYNLVMKGCYHE